MSSLAALTQHVATQHVATQHAAAPELSATGIAFYSVAATVIPVLFIAIALQSQFVQDLLSGIVNGMRELRKLVHREPRGLGDALLVIAAALLGFPALPLAFLAIVLLVLLILVFAAFGEIASIYELAAQGLGAQLGVGTFTQEQVEAVVAWSVVLLTVITLAASVLTLGQYAVRLFGGEVAIARQRRADERYGGPDDGGFSAAGPPADRGRSSVIITEDRPRSSRPGPGRAARGSSRQ